MVKPITKMTAKELIDFEFSGGDDGFTTLLESTLADKLSEAITLLDACVKQLEEYSDNELVIDWDTKKSYEIAAIKEFIGGSYDASQ